VGRPKNAAAPVDPLGKHLAGSRVVFHGDEHAAEVRHGPQGQDVLRAEYSALSVQQLLEGGSGRCQIAQGAVGQAQVVEGAECRRVVGADGQAPAVVNALVHRSGGLGLFHE
jgi:hypothetical protein